MIEVQCPSCQTRYRIDEGVLPQDSPTFKCSRCGHVFSGDPRLIKKPPAAPKPRPVQPAAQPSMLPPDPPAPPAAPPPAEPQVRPASQRPTDPAVDPEPPMQGASPSSNLQPPPRPVTPLPPRRAPLGEFQGGFPRPSQPRQANAAAAPGASYSPPPSPAAPPPRPVAPAPPPQPEERRPSEGHADNPLARSFAEEESKTPENLSFDFGDDSAEEHHLGDAPE